LPLPPSVCSYINNHDDADPDDNSRLLDRSQTPLQNNHRQHQYGNGVATNISKNSSSKNDDDDNDDDDDKPSKSEILVRASLFHFYLAITLYFCCCK
jgi:hypothetical protein